MFIKLTITRVNMVIATCNNVHVCQHVKYAAQANASYLEEDNKLEHAVSFSKL